MHQKQIIAVFFSLILAICIPLNVDAQTSRTHSVVVSDEVSRIEIPLIGTLTIFMKYSIDFEVRKPSIIDAGTTQQITLSPRNGVLTTTFYLNGNLLASIPRNLPLGSITKIAIPGTFVGEVYGSPSIIVGMGVTGPSSPSNYVTLDSMSSVNFPIRVDNEIGTSDSVRVFFPMRIDLDIGGNINLVLVNIPIRVGTVPIEVSTEISETIPLRKYITTSTSLQVKDGSNAGYIQVYPTVMPSFGGTIYTSNISLYVDGQYKGKVTSDGWSQQIHTGSGKIFVELKFPETTSSWNKAIIHKSSDASQTFDVKYPPPKPTSTQSSNQMIASAQSSGLSYSQGSSYSMDFGWLLLFLIIIGGAIGGGVVAAKRKKRKTKGDSVVQGDDSKPSSDKNETKPVLKPTTPAQKNCSHKDFWFGPDSMKICTDCGIVLGPMYVESEKPETAPAQQQLDSFLVEENVETEVKKETIHDIERNEKALGILKERLAKGEISVQEYQTIKKELS